MQQHPVPQNITGFEFKLIGFLTLRQFGYIGGAALFTFILYSAKVPIIALLVICGPILLFAFALAFLPYNGLPFERAAAAFIKDIYSPNVRVWHREPKVLGFLEPQFANYLHRQALAQEPRVHSDRTKLNQYLSSHKKSGAKSTVDLNEESRLSQLKFELPQPQKQVFEAPKLQNLSPDFNQNARQELPRLQRTPQVIQETLQRSEDQNNG